MGMRIVPHAVVTFRKVRHQSEFEYRPTYDQMYVCVYKGSQLKSKLIAMQPHRPQHDCHSVYVIAQQYSSATVDLLLFHSRKEKFFFYARSQNREKRRHVCCPSVGMEQLGFQWTSFYASYYSSIFRKSEEKVKASLN